MNNVPVSEATVAIQMVCPVLVPPLVMGLAIAAPSGTDDGVWGMVIGEVVGASAAKPRTEGRGMRIAD